MQIIAILIGLVLLAAIAFYVSRPIVQHRRSSADTTVMATLEAQRDAVYSQIRELDMDHATGKMNDEDYHQSRTDLVAQAANLLKQIDGVLSAPSAPASIATATLPASDDVEALIAARRKASVKATPAQSGGDDLEAAIAARRKKAAAPVADDAEALIAARRKHQPAASATDDVETAIAARRKSAAPTATACPTCGKPITPDDVFCSKCGTPLKAAAR
ncbi:MAG: zinc-ribbon domain-containing protein [Thermoflexales bacterium]|nr:zinc-ribbon domain-containing protein [Thermoflexales bacterium]